MGDPPGRAVSVERRGELSHTKTCLCCAEIGSECRLNKEFLCRSDRGEMGDLKVKSHVGLHICHIVHAQ